MRIVHLNAVDIQGGAARAIYRVHRGLLALGEDSSLVVRRKLSTDATVAAFEPSDGLTYRLRRRPRKWAIARDASRYLGARPPGYEWFSDDRSVLGSELARGLPKADIISLNWVAGFVDLEFFRALSPARQLVWRLPDMNPFTGGCHYDAGCERYVESCGNCPQLASPARRDLSAQIWRRKREAYDGLAENQLQLVAISACQAEEVRRSSLMSRFPLTVIPCGVDVDTFFPRPKSAARDCLRLPQDRPIVLMVADYFDRPNKGAPLLSAALGLLESSEPPLLLTVGRGNPRFPRRFEHTHWDLVSDDRLLPLLYSAADLLAFPSLQEGFGQTIVEALACGLPVVGFEVGGMRDAIVPGSTGFIARAKTADALAHALQSALADVDRLRGLSPACREIAEERFSVQVVAKSYRHLYESLVRTREFRGRADG